jgi:hypothetical protein
MRAFWDTAPCSLVWVYRRFRGAYCLHHFWNVGLLQRDYTALYSRRLPSSEPEISLGPMSFLPPVHHRKGLHQLLELCCVMGRLATNVTPFSCQQACVLGRTQRCLAMLGSVLTEFDQCLAIYVSSALALGQDFLQLWCSCQYHSAVALQTRISPGGWTIGPLVAAVLRHSLTLSTWTTTTAQVDIFHFP